MIKNCETCVYEELSSNAEPCSDCETLGTGEPTEWTSKESCHNCKFACVSSFGEPCRDCVDHQSEWQPIEDAVNHPNDAVNHPNHYCTGKYECLDVMLEVFGVEEVIKFCLCNSFKYLYRAKRKNGLEDIKKAKFYLEKIIELSEN